jgi:hypothetical protein
MVNESLPDMARQIHAFASLCRQASARIGELNALMPAAAEIGGILSTSEEAMKDGTFAVRIEPETVVRYLKSEIMAKLALCEGYERKARQIIEILNEA